MNNLCIFEDLEYENFLPLSYTRPVYELACGFDTLLGRIIKNIPHDSLSLYTRDYLKESLKEKHLNVLINNFATAGKCLFVNGRLIFDKEKFESLKIFKQACIYINEQEDILLAYLDNDNLNIIKSCFENGVLNNKLAYERLRNFVLIKKIDIDIVSYPWQLIAKHQLQANKDKKHLELGIIKGKVETLARLKEEENIYIGKNSIISDFSVLDTTNGPIFIGDNVLVEPFSYLRGPIFIGDNCVIKQASISNCFIGEHCKIGGEVKDSIFLGYTNKAHSGFIGNSYIGEWVNLGALTTNSNLKNNYKTVNIELENKAIDSKEQFLGCIIGDHSKLGIGTLLNTGIVIGIACNLFGGSLFKTRNICSFLWGNESNFLENEFDKVIETIKLVMPRKNRQASDYYIQLLKTVFEISWQKRAAITKRNNQNI